MSCSLHREEFVQKKLAGETFLPQECCVEQQKFDKRTPGLFKLEWEGKGFVGLCSKTYYCFGGKTKKKDENKQVSKGLKTKHFRQRHIPQRFKNTTKCKRYKHFFSSSQKSNFHISPDEKWTSLFLR